MDKEAFIKSIGQLKANVTAKGVKLPLRELYNTITSLGSFDDCSNAFKESAGSGIATLQVYQAKGAEYPRFIHLMMPTGHQFLLDCDALRPGSLSHQTTPTIFPETLRSFLKTATLIGRCEDLHAAEVLFHMKFEGRKLNEKVMYEAAQTHLNKTSSTSTSPYSVSDLLLGFEIPLFNSLIYEEKDGVTLQHLVTSKGVLCYLLAKELLAGAPLDYQDDPIDETIEASIRSFAANNKKLWNFVLTQNAFYEKLNTANPIQTLSIDRKVDLTRKLKRYSQPVKSGHLIPTSKRANLDQSLPALQVDDPPAATSTPKVQFDLDDRAPEPLAEVPADDDDDDFEVIREEDVVVEKEGELSLLVRSGDEFEDAEDASAAPVVNVNVNTIKKLEPPKYPPRRSHSGSLFNPDAQLPPINPLAGYKIPKGRGKSSRSSTAPPSTPGPSSSASISAPPSHRTLKDTIKELAETVEDLPKPGESRDKLFHLKFHVFTPGLCIVCGRDEDQCPSYERDEKGDPVWTVGADGRRDRKWLCDARKISWTEWNLNLKCRYSICEVKFRHRTKTCPDVAVVCTRCGLRGHRGQNCGKFGRDYATYRAAWHEAAPINIWTKDYKTDPIWGFGPFNLDSGELKTGYNAFN